MNACNPVYVILRQHVTTQTVHITARVTMVILEMGPPVKVC